MATLMPMKNTGSLTSALVTREWLLDTLNNKACDVIILEASRESDGYENFKSKRISTARFFDLTEETYPSAKIPFDIAQPAAFQEHARKLGIRHDSHVIVYDQASIPGLFAARLWWNLRAYGHERVSILDGSFLHYEKHPQAVTSSGEEEEREVGDFTAVVNNSLIKDFDEMNAIVDEMSSQIVDTRLPANFTGGELEPASVLLLYTKEAGFEFHPNMISGHHKGATNLPFSELTDPDTAVYKNKEEVIEMLKTMGVDLQKPITITCYLGYTACMLAAALHYSGICRDAAVYFGSWTEWSQRKAEE